MKNKKNQTLKKALVLFLYEKVKNFLPVQSGANLADNF